MFGDNMSNTFQQIMLTIVLAWTVHTRSDASYHIQTAQKHYGSGNVTLGGDIITIILQHFFINIHL